MPTNFPLHHYAIPHLDEYIQDRRLRGLRDASIYQRCLTIRRLSRHITPTSPAEATTEQLSEFLLRQHRDGRSLSQGTRAGEAACLRSFFEFLVRAGRRYDDPTTTLPRTMNPRRFPRPIGEPDLEIAIALADSRMTAWLRLAAYAGLRAAEIAALRHENVMLSNKLIIIQDGKGGKPGAVPAHAEVVAALTTWGLKSVGWVFPHYYDPDAHIAPWSVSAKTARYLRSIGIDATIHQLRHRFGTEVYKTSGHDLRTTQELLRHQSPVSTAIYTQLNPADGRAAVEAL